MQEPTTYNNDVELHFKELIRRAKALDVPRHVFREMLEDLVDRYIIKDASGRIIQEVEVE